MQKHRLSAVILSSLILIISTIHAQDHNASKRIYRTHHLIGSTPEINGVLDDPCWQQGEWSLNYIQQQPYEGKPPSQNTTLKILYDDKNIYVAIRAYDTEPEKIDKQLSRRDAFSGDIVGVNFDSYFDHRTGFEFNLTAAGSKLDLVLLNDGWDTSWNAVWDGKVAMEDTAWTAEMRIPLSQLRYGDKKEHIWGLHAWRWINRYQEEDQWNLIPRDAPGFVYCFGELHGIKDLKPIRRIELLPYAVGKLSTAKSSDNPFVSKRDSDYAFGLDGKIGLSSDFTMDLTLNPDFGQVEADPSDMNLTAFETFFEEKRPFFLEGRNILEYELDDDNLFYSRRIGHAPSYYPDLNDGEYARNPDNTTILNAVKVTGKTATGLSVGIVQSITAKEHVDLQSRDEKKYKKISEPLSNYFISRIQKDFDQGNTFIGGMFTSTNRKIGDDHLNFLNRAAYTGGLDFRHHFKNKTYFLDVKTIFSNIHGNVEAIQTVQESSAHYFQRPDAEHIHLDTTRTALSGHGGRIQFAKESNGRWRFSERLSWRSPGLELNDLGYMRRADYIAQENQIEYVVTDPGSILRSYNLFLDLDNEWDYSGQYSKSDLAFHTSVTFLNKWGGDLQFQRDFDYTDTRLLRGGSAMKQDGFWFLNTSAHTDDSKRISGYGYFSKRWFDDALSKNTYWGQGFAYKMTQALTCSGDLDFAHEINAWQYITTATVDGTNQYLLGQIDQKTLALTFRIELGITPDLTIQYYGSPFVSAGQFDHFKRITNPKANQWQDRFRAISEDEMVFLDDDDQLQVNENGGLTYTLDNPDFNFREFRSNLVVRWEYKPGSTLYLVWTQGRNSFSEQGRYHWSKDMNHLFDAYPNNVFLIKMNRWFSL